jgi:AraC family ethanolamine operon transcriptional activator
MAMLAVDDSLENGRRMDRFPPGLIVRVHTDDFDTMAAAAAGWDQQYTQLGHGRFRGFIFGGHTRNLQIGVVRWSTDFLVNGHVPAGCVSVVFPLRFATPPRVEGLPVDADHLGTVSADQGFTFRSFGASSLLVLSIDRQVLDDAAMRRLGASWDETGRPRDRHRRRLRSRESTLGALCTILGSIRRAPGSLADPDVATRVEQASIAIVLGGIRVEPCHPPAAARRRIARRALDYMQANLDRPTRIHELCAALAVPERSLHLAFREYFGLPPITLLRTLRLHGARRDLHAQGAATTVTDIATRWGFFHLGEFATAYLRHFGELPSQALRGTGWSPPRQHALERVSLARLSSS